MSTTAELFVFGRFHARTGCEDALGEAVRNVVIPLPRGGGGLRYPRVPLCRKPVRVIPR
jgi:hypothetical protein